MPDYELAIGIDNNGYRLLEVRPPVKEIALSASLDDLLPKPPAWRAEHRKDSSEYLFPPNTNPELEANAAALVLMEAAVTKIESVRHEVGFHPDVVELDSAVVCLEHFSSMAHSKPQRINKSVVY